MRLRHADVVSHEVLEAVPTSHGPMMEPRRRHRIRGIDLTSRSGEDVVPIWPADVTLLVLNRSKD